MNDKKDTGVVNIHGRTYETVALRVKKFREGAGKELTLCTEVVERNDEWVVMKAIIAAPDGRIYATGHAEEKRSSSQINRTSALENAETSAIGRALAAFGLGGTEFATADEVANAIGQQKSSAKSVPQDTWDNLDEEERLFLQGVADRVRAAMEKDGPESGLAVLEASKLDNDERVAIWSRFDSKERAAIKSAAKKAA